MAISAKASEIKTKESNKQKLLGIIIDRNLNFDKPIIDMFKNAARKLFFSARLLNDISLEKKRTSLKALVESQFG